MNDTLRNGLVLVLVGVLFQFFGDQFRGAGGILIVIGLVVAIVGLLRRTSSKTDV